MKMRCTAPALLLALACAAAGAAESPADAAQGLRSRQQALLPQLQRNAFGQPLVLESVERDRSLSGDVYAVLPHPFTTVQASLKRAAQWCDVLMLHLNVKHCEPTPQGLAVNVGRKHDQPLADTYRLELTQRVTADTADFLRVQMAADEGPVGTRDYLFVLEAVPADGGKSFVHFRYAYGYGLAAKLAMQAYVNTVGSDKIGFSTAAPAEEGEAGGRVGGVRGAIERNTMRYYLAIATYLDTLTLPPEERTERRLRDWFAATERFPQQLHELNRDEYLKLKRSQLKAQPAP